MKEQKQLSTKRSATLQDCDALEKAFVKLAGMSEKELKNAKKAVWFGQVYDLVMFTDKEEARVADRISSVEQAQQILIDMLLTLGETDESIYILVRRHKEELWKMCEQTIWLYSRIKRLEIIAELGLDDDLDIRGISENARKVLCALLHWLQEEPLRTAPNELQKEFVGFMFRYLRLMDPRIDDPFGVLEVFEKEPDERKKMLACCLEYIYLGSCDDRAFDAYGGLISQFNVDIREERLIEDKIAQLYRYRGVKGFYSRYIFHKGDVSQTSFSAEFEREGD